MTATLTAYSGSSFRANVKLWQRGKTARVDTTGSTMHFQLRSARHPNKEVLDASEVTTANPPDDTTFRRVDEGEWEIFLGKTQTAQFPAVMDFEFRLINDDNPEDAMTLAIGTLKVEQR